MRDLRLGTGLLAAALLLGATACDRAAETAPTGRIVYERHCAACHGLDGRGNGPVAASLDDPPADLTLLAARNGGHFDERAVVAVIDGRRAVEEHGPREMPVWGAAFETELATERYPRYTTFLRIRDITDYLRSIQRAE